jgi:rhamnosyl/mannosyltransferase
VGVLRYYKGLHVLLQAARHSNYPIAIAGAGPMESELKRQAEDLGLNHVHFLGYLDESDKKALIEGSLGVVFPSHLRSEAFGISLLEGAMCAKPMISSEIGTGTTFINIHQQSGLVVPPTDPQALHQAMQALWTDLEAASTMGQRARERYLQMFTARQMAQAYFQLYQAVLAERRA